MHPLCQRSFLLIKRLRPPNRLPTRPPRFPCSRATLATQLQFKLCQARQNARHHPTRRVRRIDALTQRPKHDPALTKLTDGSHHLGSVAPQAINADHHDGVPFTGVVQERS